MNMTVEDPRHEHIRSQFAQRIQTYEKAATWMLSPELIEAQRRAAGPAPAGSNLCLDMCCGTGIVGRNLLDLGWDVKGLDLTPEMGWVASQYFPVKIGSVEKIDMPSESFDLATLRQSFMLVDGPSALKEIYRILKPGGRFIIIQSTSFSNADEDVYEKVQGARHINQKTYYRAVDLENSFKEHGFKIARVEMLRVRESVDHWLNSAPELAPELRTQIRQLISTAPEGYRQVRDVREVGGELFEDWNWMVLTGLKE